MTDLASVDLNLLVSLDLLLEERSVRGAARRAHLSPSAMSHTLGRLRDLLGDEILVRAGRQMVPTPRAESLVEPLKSLLAGARSLLTDATRFDPQHLQRRFRVVCTDHAAAVLLSRADRLFRLEAPEMDLTVAPLVPDTMADLRKGHVDAAIGVFPEAAPEVRTRGLFDDRFVTVCRPDHPRLAEGELTLPRFLAERHVLVAPRGDAEGLVDRVLATTGDRRRVSRTFPSFLSALWHVAQSDELLTISSRLVAEVRPRLPLRAVATPLHLDDYRMVLAWHPRTDKAVEDVWFRSVLIRTAQDLPALNLLSLAS